MRRSRPTWRPEHPYQEWLDNGLFRSTDCRRAKTRGMLPPNRHAVAVGIWLYLYEGAQPAGSADGFRLGAEPIGSMGTDTPVAVLSQSRACSYDHFHQLFAQVPTCCWTPSLWRPACRGTTGGERDLPNPESLLPQIVLPQPIPACTTSSPALVSLTNDKVMPTRDCGPR